MTEWTKPAAKLTGFTILFGAILITFFRSVYPLTDWRLVISTAALIGFLLAVAFTIYMTRRSGTGDGK